MTRTAIVLFACLAAIALAGCGDDDAGSVQVTEAPGEDVGFGEGTVVVSGDDTFVVTGDPGGECVEINGDCVQVDGGVHCNEDGAQVDVIVVDGEVVDVICYPPDEPDNVDTVISDGDGNVEIPQNANGSVVTFDEGTDGEPIEGNVRIDSERTALYGNGPGDTIIDGNVTLASNNSRVRGMTIMGNLVYEQNANNSAASFCEVHGNLQVSANGFTATNCVVWGNVDIQGNGATLVNIGVQGDWNPGGDPICDGCYSFDDANEDFVVDDAEIGDDLTCGPGEAP